MASETHTFHSWKLVGFPRTLRAQGAFKGTAHRSTSDPSNSQRNRLAHPYLSASRGRVRSCGCTGQQAINSAASASGGGTHAMPELVQALNSGFVFALGLFAGQFLRRGNTRGRSVSTRASKRAGPLPPASSLATPGRTLSVVTTAALPWRTGECGWLRKHHKHAMHRSTECNAWRLADMQARLSTPCCVLRTLPSAWKAARWCLLASFAMRMSRCATPQHPCCCPPR